MHEADLGSFDTRIERVLKQQARWGFFFWITLQIALMGLWLR